MRWIALALTAALVIPLITLGPRGSVVALKTAAFIPEIFPDAPVKPLRWFTGPPSVERSTLSYGGGDARLDVYVPAARGPHGGVILMLGARPLDQEDPMVTRFADALSRLGVVVMVPASDGLAAGRITPEEIDLLVREMLELRMRPDVDTARLGFIGLSVGASLALVAAADDRVRDQVKFVEAFGGYFDARDLFVALASGSLEYAGLPGNWEPAPLAREVMRDNLLAGLPSEDERACVLEADCDAASLSPTAQLTLRLLDHPNTAQAERLVDTLVASSSNQLAAISPRGVVDRIAADVLVMHDVNDRYIPYTESLHLVGALPPARLRAWTELELFDHVVPGKRLDPISFTRELAQLFHHVYLTFMELL